MAKPNNVKRQRRRREPKIPFRIGGKQHLLTYDQAFWIGYKLLQSQKYETAERVFGLLTKVRGHDRLLNLVLARCQAGLDHYDVCKDLLTRAFGDAEEPVAEKLHTAIVFKNLGMLEGAIEKLVGVANQRPDLPSIFLFLGDMLAAAGSLEKASGCWKLAVKKNGPGGTVTRTARRLLQRLSERDKR